MLPQNKTATVVTDLNAYQAHAMRSAIYPDQGSNLVYPVLGLANEAGEVAGKLKKQIRDKVERSHDLRQELGDVLWYVAAVASELGVTLSDIATENIAKLSSRQARGTLSGDGDQR